MYTDDEVHALFLLEQKDPARRSDVSSTDLPREPFEWRMLVEGAHQFRRHADLIRRGQSLAPVLKNVASSKG